LAKFLSGIKLSLIISERYTLSFSHEGWFDEFLRRFTIRNFYPKANRIIVNSKNMGIELQQMFNIPLSKIAVINNPIDIQKVNKLSNENINHSWNEENFPVIIAIGRLTSQKGFSYLIKAFSIVVSDGIPCRLLILGEGVDKEKLKKLAMELRVDDKVSLLGFQKNPYKYLCRSTLFVLSSLYEGFPNVLLEALALGVPSIATRCPTGPEEIITHEVDGILTPPADEMALANAIKRGLLDQGLRKRLGEAGKKRAENFRVKKIVRQYEEVIEDVCAASVEN
jgi:glycosyltransferase involved in cell wall biosynthesis